MTKTIISKERTGNFTLFLICGAGLIIFFVIVLYPRYKLIIQKQSDIAEIKHQISDQKEMIPQLAMKMIEADRLKLPDGLVSQSKKPFLPDEKEKLLSLIEESAVRYHLKTESIVVDGENILMSLSTIKQNDKDSFTEIYPFLMELKKMTYAERIERIVMRAVGEIKKIEIRIRVVKK